MRGGSYKFKRPRCCGAAMVSAYIRHGQRSPAPGLEKIGLYCPRCRRFEVIEPVQAGLEKAMEKYPVLEHVAAALKPHMHLVRGLYLHGSRARGDYREDSDYDLLLITQHKIDENHLKAELEKYNVQLECLTLKQAEQQLVAAPSYLLTVLREGVPLIGEALREQLLEKGVKETALLSELEDCKRQLGVLKDLLKEELDVVDKSAILYSAITRLRRAYEIKRLHDRSTPLLAEDFRKYYSGDFEQVFESYRKLRDLPTDLRETDVPVEIKKMNKTMLKKLVNSTDAYIEDAYHKLTDMLAKQK